MRKSDRENLYGCRLFNNTQYDRLDDYFALEGAEISSFTHGSVIFSPDCFSRSLGIIVKGRASVYKLHGGGHRVLMSRLVRSDIFGMASLFYESEHFLTEITADTDCRVMFLSKQWVENVFAADEGICRNYIVLLSERIHFLNSKIESFTASDSTHKLKKYLLSLAPAGTCKRVQIKIPCPLTRLSSMLDIGRSSLYRAFETLEQQGMIIRNGDSVIINEKAFEDEGHL